MSGASVDEKKAAAAGPQGAVVAVPKITAESTLEQINGKIAEVLTTVPAPYAQNYRERARKFDSCRTPEAQDEGRLASCMGELAREENALFANAKNFTSAETVLEALELQRRMKITLAEK